MGRAVARRTNLGELFNRARRVPGQWAIDSENLEQATHPCLAAGGYLDRFEHWTETPALPSIPLVRCVHAVLFPTLRVERDGRPRPFNVSAAQDNGYPADVRDGWIELTREIRLALGPTTSANEIGLLFGTRAYVRLSRNRPEPDFVEVRPSCTLKPKDDLSALVPPAVFQWYNDGVWHRIAVIERIDDLEAQVFSPGATPLYWRINPLDPHSPEIEHWYVSWSAVNEATLSHWLDRPSGTNDAITVRYGGAGRGNPVWHLRGSVAHEVEQDLATRGLEVALEKSVERLRQALADRESHWRSDAQVVHQQRMASWQEIAGNDVLGD